MEEDKMQFLYGIHPVMEAVKAGRRFDKVLLKQGLEGQQFRELYGLLGEKNIPYQFVPIDRLNRAVRGAHQGVVAYISQIDYVELEDMVNNALAKTASPILVRLNVSAATVSLYRQRAAQQSTRRPSRLRREHLCAWTPAGCQICAMPPISSSSLDSGSWRPQRRWTITSIMWISRDRSQ